MYYLKNKNHESIVPLMKRHLHSGGVLFSDMHSMYVHMHNAKSKLSPYGIYHMWTNHAETMVHYKYRFIHTLNIEREWLHLKRKFSMINFAHNAKAIQDWCNIYTIHKGILKPEFRYDFWLKMIRYYYFDMLQQFRIGIPDQDTLEMKFISNGRTRREPPCLFLLMTTHTEKKLIRSINLFSEVKPSITKGTDTMVSSMVVSSVVQRSRSFSILALAWRL